MATGPPQVKPPASVDYSNLTNTLTPIWALIQALAQGQAPEAPTLGEAQQGQDMDQLHAQVQAQQQAAQQAGQQYQQAATAPQGPPPSNFVNQLFGNTASVLGQQPEYGRRAFEQGQDLEKTLAQHRAQNLAALKDQYEKLQHQAETSGKTEQAAQYRQKIDSATKALQLVTKGMAGEQGAQNLATKGQQVTDLQTQRGQQATDLETQKEQARWKELQAKISAGAYQRGSLTPGSLDDAHDIAEAIRRGDQPPDLKSMYKLAGAIRADLARSGYPLYAAQQDQAAYGQFFRSQNTGRQLQLRQNVERAYESLDVIDELNDKLIQSVPRSRFPVLNRVTLAAVRGGAAGMEAQNLAIQLEGQIADVSQELSNVFSGGYAPTDQALKLASKNLKANWAPETIRAMTGQLRRNLQIRRNSISNAGAITPSNLEGAPTGKFPWTPAGASPSKGNVGPGFRRKSDIQAGGGDENTPAEEMWDDSGTEPKVVE